ncbi:hypothetical protein [Massilia rhizosphaerae]|uniref:hypothetical protein n=1 Tax=Massilia rhizosphaerae TaxID=2784389 RepID=UPI0018DC2DB2|nr:hypothetical protein [Massilia rhizosphaerae]
MKIRLSFILCLATLLQGCVPIPTRNTDEKYYYLPTSNAPLHSYSNGADLHRYFDCYRSLDGDRETCHPQYVVVEHGDKPDWQPIVLNHDAVNLRLRDDLPGFKPVLSAYSGTTRRVVGRWEEDRSTEKPNDYFPNVAFVDYDAAANKKLAQAERRGGMDSIDIWFNEPWCRYRSKPTLPMLVVEDESSTWIFVDMDPACQSSAADLRVPADMMRFDRPERFADVLHKPMNLFYLPRRDTDSRRPRFVTSDPVRLKNRPDTVIAPEHVPVPAEKVFNLEYNEFHDPLDAMPASNFQCNFSKILLVQWVVGWVDTYPTLDGCKSIAARLQHKK